MIVDSFKNCERYYSLNKYFEKAFEYVKSKDFLNIENGRYEIDGDNIYVNVEEYTTKTLSKAEFHKKYIDIQFLVKGIEYIGYCPVDKVVIEEDYDDNKDVGFGLGVVNYIKMFPGQFMILYPQDAHQPCMADGEPKNVKKVVVKVKAD